MGVFNKITDKIDLLYVTQEMLTLSGETWFGFWIGSWIQYFLLLYKYIICYLLSLHLLRKKCD